MRTILLAATLLATPALATDHPTPPKVEVKCTSLDKFEKALNKEGGTTFTKATPGQFHFLVGFYVGSPSTPAGLPPGDGAVIASHGMDTMIIWTRGSLACNPLMVDAKLLVLMAKFKAGGDDADTL